MGEGLARASADYARRAAELREWQRSLDFARTAVAAGHMESSPLVAEALFRLARERVLDADFPAAEQLADEAVSIAPREPRYQRQLELIRKAKGLRLQEMSSGVLRVGDPAGADLWGHGLLREIRGWDGQGASVPAPTIMSEISRPHIEDVYALGKYVPWHEGGLPRLFTLYIKELKKHGKTAQLAAVLLWQGLTGDEESTAPDWIAEIDVVVPMATSLASFEVRGHEVSEEIALQLSRRLCVPYVDVFEREVGAASTHQLSGYGPRLDALLGELTVKTSGVADLRSAQGVLIVDDVVTYGSTFEACAIKLQESHPQVRCWGAALAYTETERRREKALEERAGSPPEQQ